jgi:hypothetical protein
MLHYCPLDSRIENANAMQAFVILAASIVFDTSMVIIYPSLPLSNRPRLQECGSDHHEAGGSTKLNTAGSTNEGRDGWGGGCRGSRDEAGG